MTLQIFFGRYDPEAKADSSVTLNGASAFSVPDDLKTDGITVGDFMTGEDNFAILDGRKTEWPDDTSLHHWGLYSESMSDADGNFPSDALPGFEVEFSQNHKSPGFTLLFYPQNDDYANQVRVTWYDETNAVMLTNTYALTSNIGLVHESQDGYRRLKYEFLSTNLPYRYIKLYGLEYGIAEVFSDGEIFSEQLSESVDPISDTIQINQFRFNIKTHNAAFSLLSGNVEDNMLMRKQKLDLKVDNNHYGTFFLDEWGDNDGTGVDFNFSAVDAIGVMDGYRFYGGMYNNAPVAQVLDEIFTVCFPTGLVGYRLDDGLDAVTVSGYIPVCTCREALQYVCFAMGGIADTSRRDYVWIYKRDIEISFDLPRERIYIGSPVAPTDYYSGVDLTAYSYQQISETATAFNGILSPGQHLLTFTEPLWGVAVTGATVLETHVNYVRVTVAARATVTVTGKRYSPNANAYSVRDTVEAGEVESVAVFDGCTLVTLDNAEALVQGLFDYLKYRIRMNLDMRPEDIECGFLGRIHTRGKPVVGIVESLTGSVRAGRAQAVIIGALEV